MILIRKTGQLKTVQSINLLRRLQYDNNELTTSEEVIQELERQRQMLSGAVLIVLGIASSALSATVGGSNVKDFMFGLLLGLSIVEMIADLVTVVKQPLGK